MIKSSRFAYLATVLCASLFFSCTPQSTKYCVYSERQECFPTSQPTCPSGGELSDFCPYGNSGTPSSSSFGGSCTGGTVKIGTQVWQKCNLNVAAAGSKCYNDDPANCDKYGRLYDWSTAMALSSSCNSSTCASQVGAKHRGICPNGWHIPRDAEWKTLTSYVGTNAGTKLKATSGWNSSGNGTDDYGFAALPGGGGYSGGYFSHAGNYGNWWSATEGSAYSAYRRSMDYDREGVDWYRSSKSSLFSVRCLQD
ncbi:hypothetical protein R83H12_00820 [Fibrobacteria bacterium R8-3-H12]